METTNPTETGNPTQSNTQSFDERKEHYEALITLFKYAIGSLTLVITVAGFFIGFTVYSDGREMRAAMREQQTALQQNLMDLNKKELEMQKTLLDLIKTTREDVSTTGQRAINQINSIREESSSIARAEAKKRIEQVFEENKIEDFIVEITKKELEPQVRQIVDSKIGETSQAKLEKALRGLVSGDETKQSQSLLYFQNSDPSDWTDEQLKMIVNVMKNVDDNNFIKSEICIYLGLTKSKILDDYFQTELLKNSQIARIFSRGI